MKNCHNIFCCILKYGYHFPIETVIFWGVNIGRAKPISISRYSDSLYWLSLNIRKMDLSPKIWILSTMYFSHIFYCGNRCPIEPLKKNVGESWLRYAQYLFLVTQIQCIGYHRIVENGSRPVNINNCRNILLPSCRVWITLSHRAFEVFWCVNIGPVTPTSIYCYSESVSLWS